MAKKKEVQPEEVKKPVETYTIEAKYFLTDEEKHQAGRDLAHREKQAEQIEKDRKERMSAFKSQADEVRSQIADLSNKVTMGYEFKKFRCIREIDYKRKLRVFKDVDTGEVRDERPIEPDDYQARMNL